jgi:hypothetical protein
MKKFFIVFICVFIVGLSLFYIIPTFQYVYLDSSLTIKKSDVLKYDWSWSTVDNKYFKKYSYKENAVSSLFVIEQYNYNEYMNVSINEIGKLSKEVTEYKDKKLTEIVWKNEKVYSFKIGKTKFIVNN